MRASSLVRRFVWPCVVCLASTMGGRCGRAADFTMPFSYDTRQIVVQATVGGEAVAMMIDTGAPLSVLDARMARQLGLVTGGEVTVEGLGGTTSGELGYVPSLKVGGLSVKPLFMVVMDMEAFQRAFGPSIRGILGYDFLQQYQTTIDYSRRTVSFSEPPAALEDGVSFAMAGCMPRLKAMAEGQVFDADLDTGATGSTLPVVLSSRLRLGYRHVGRGVGLAGVSYVRYVARLKSLSVGQAHAQDVLVGYRSPLLYDAEELPTIGRLGNNFLQRFRLTINYRCHRLRLDPAETVAIDYEAVHPGIQVGLKGDAIVVEAVYPRSPADEAGVHKGDRILRIGGRSTAELSLFLAARALEGPVGSTVEVRVARGDRELVVSLKRMDWLP